MKKLDERDPASGRGPLAAAPALAVQFFLIPLAVVGVLVLVYAGFRMMIEDQRTAQDYLNDIRSGGRERRWPAAYELSRLMAEGDAEAKDPTLGVALLRAFEETGGDDPRVRRYLALALGRLESPPPGTVEALLGALDDADSETVISAAWALASLGEQSAVPRLRRLYESSDAGVRKIAVYALGALPGEEQEQTLRAALNDPAADVQWNAAVALARHGDGAAVPVLRRMLNREYVERVVDRSTGTQAESDPVSDVMISGLRAIGALGDASLSATVADLSREDRSLQVRQVALETLEQIRTDQPQG